MTGYISIATILITFIISSCNNVTQKPAPKTIFDYYDWNKIPENDDQKLLHKYTPFKLTADLSQLSDNQRKMIKILIEAAAIMDDLFWYDAYGDKIELLQQIDNEALKVFALINYGPWDRLSGNASFIDGIGDKPAGANFYPQDMSKEEFEAADLPDKSSLYTYIRRHEDGKLTSLPYHKEFSKEVSQVSDLLKKAAELAENEGLKKYLML